ncbi:hypothetical protein CONPUDRAFT_76051 [Coniophora puteana RWD-64-598 SS2]|uniref:Uncharacterized protein n=1 Tax=Coniophora puteana (strain RWD-64-598) TaxID=741705 RepID=A0A5M3MFC2_CONPW|nr:uncharacterized protein CONPUDRAFT_76051 [Coniophora puteana RWD-64-598 SS2]EIW77291.1 hypothetical protein CONPUDRAFT_76051 [Coniophora puteana RWD-64-598 SS2]
MPVPAPSTPRPRVPSRVDNDRNIHVHPRLRQVLRLEPILHMVYPQLTADEMSQRFIMTVGYAIDARLRWESLAAITCIALEFSLPITIPIDPIDYPVYFVWMRTPDQHPMSDSVPYVMLFHVFGGGSAHSASLRVSSLADRLVRMLNTSVHDSVVQYPDEAMAYVDLKCNNSRRLVGMIHFRDIFAPTFARIQNDCQSERVDNAFVFDGRFITITPTSIRPSYQYLRATLDDIREHYPQMNRLSVSESECHGLVPFPYGKLRVYGKAIASRLATGLTTRSRPYCLDGNLSLERRDVANKRPLDLQLAFKVALAFNDVKDKDKDKDGSMSWITYNLLLHDYIGELISSPINTLPPPESLQVLLVWDESSDESRFREHGAFSISFHVHGGGLGHRQALRLSALMDHFSHEYLHSDCMTHSWENVVEWLRVWSLYYKTYQFLFNRYCCVYRIVSPEVRDGYSCLLDFNI